MTDCRPAERRKERRYIVCGVDCWIDGRPTHIVDISRSGVRMLLPPALTIEDRPYDIVFNVPESGQMRSFRVSAQPLRHTEHYVVLTYAPPCAEWEALLLSLDTFELTRLSAI